MTRKDYQVLAESLQTALNEADQGGEFRGVILATCKIMDALAADNPRFDRARFAKVVVDLPRYRVPSYRFANGHDGFDG